MCEGVGWGMFWAVQVTTNNSTDKYEYGGYRIWCTFWHKKAYSFGERVKVYRKQKIKYLNRWWTSYRKSWSYWNIERG